MKSDFYEQNHNANLGGSVVRPIEAVPVDAHVVEAQVVQAHVVTPGSQGGELTPGVMTPYSPGRHRDGVTTEYLKCGSKAAYPTILLGFILFILGIATMNYIGYGAGAWYAALFQMLCAFLFLSATSEGGRCGQPRCLIVSSLVVGIIALILSFIGTIADFVWMSFGKAIDVCDERELVGTKHSMDLTMNNLMREYMNCNKECFAAHFDGDDSLSLCYNTNWGDCSDFCDGNFPTLAGICGGLGIVSFFLLVTLTGASCCGLCNFRRY